MRGSIYSRNKMFKKKLRGFIEIGNLNLLYNSQDLFLLITAPNLGIIICTQGEVNKLLLRIGLLNVQQDDYKGMTLKTYISRY